MKRKWTLEQYLKDREYLDQKGTQVASGFLNVFNGIASLLGLNFAKWEKDKDLDQVNAIADRVAKLADKILRDYENKQSISTPTTGAAKSLDSYINDIYSKYTQDAYEILKLTEQIKSDSESVRMSGTSIKDLTHSKDLVEDAKYVEKQALDKVNHEFKELGHKAVDAINKQENAYTQGMTRRNYGLQKKTQ